MTRKAVAITGNSVKTKQREVFLKRKRSSYEGVFKLKITNFVATSNQRKFWSTARIICFNKSFQRNCTISTGIPNW